MCYGFSKVYEPAKDNRYRKIIGPSFISSLTVTYKTNSSEAGF
jgi:hypothetical protein